MADMGGARAFEWTRIRRRQGGAEGGMAAVSETGVHPRSASETVDTRPFAGFEWMLALRYLRARRKEGFI